MEWQKTEPVPSGWNRKEGEKPGVALRPQQMDGYLEELETSGCLADTLQSYRRNLKLLYRFLEEDKYVRPGTLGAWQRHLLESGYAVSTVNVCTSAANGLVLYLGHGELQTERLPEGKTVQPELTRAEYLRLLSAARSRGRERAYLLIKLFGAAGLSVRDVDKVTAEAAREGKIRLSSGNLRIPGGLQTELLHYVEDRAIRSGPIFLTRDGKPQGRTAVTGMIKSLCRDAQVPEEKANPRCLRKLYQATQAGILDNISVLVDQAYDRLLEKEQNVIGWS